jgi:hypothetical protein
MAGQTFVVWYSKARIPVSFLELSQAKIRLFKDPQNKGEIEGGKA